MIDGERSNLIIMCEIEVGGYRNTKAVIEELSVL